jgi:hypothetical protein
MVKNSRNVRAWSWASRSSDMRRARLILFVASILLALATVEVGLRFIGGVFDDTFMRFDNERGWSLRPGFAGWVKNERVMWMQINADGMRDRERSRTAPPGTLRVAAIGDSYMQGINVPSEHTFAAFLEARLERCLASSGITPEVLNFGVSGYGTAQELITYRRHAANYRPDIVVLAVYTGNDIADNSLAFSGDSVPERPYYVLRDGALVLDESFRARPVIAEPQPWWRSARELVTGHVRTAQLVYETWDTVRSRGLSLFDDGTPNPDTETAESIYQTPASSAAIAAWEVTEALLRQFATEVRANGAEPWIVTLANGDQIETDPAVRRARLDELGVEMLFYPDRRIAALADAHGIDVVSLAEPMSAMAIDRQVQMRGGYSDAAPLGTGHWNETGNRVAAELTGDRLCAASPAIARVSNR